MAIKILDCTLRDGSYSNAFAFTAEDTVRLVDYLSRCSVPLIEVGHGLGLGASGPKYGYAAETDEVYIRCACASKRSSQIGCFVMPGIASTDNIQKAYDHGLSFIRIGCSPDNLDSALEFARVASKIGISIYLNLMKSYALDVDQVIDFFDRTIALRIAGFYIVDSAGCMLPQDIRRYIKALREFSTAIPIGFHGHNNLGLALSSSIEAVNAGASIIDCTIGGIGRMGGNAQFEVFLHLCHAYFIENNIITSEVRDASDLLTVDLLAETPYIKHLYYTLGASGIHSSQLPVLKAIADKKGVGIDRLISAMGNIERLSTNQTFIEFVADILLENKDYQL